MPKTTGNYRVVGKCGLCGGRVTVPDFWLSVVPPVPSCERCGAAVDDTAFLPTLPMRPKGCPQCGHLGLHFCTGGQPPHPGWVLVKRAADRGGYCKPPPRR